METMLLNNPEVYPDETVLRKVLGKSYTAFRKLIESISGPGYNLLHEWRYYNDGRSWLCKVVHKKKTVFWLSAWDGYFRTTFYFTEKARAGVAALDIEPEIKKTFASARSTGKLIPLRFLIREADQLYNLLKVVSYKMKAK